MKLSFTLCVQGKLFNFWFNGLEWKSKGSLGYCFLFAISILYTLNFLPIRQFGTPFGIKMC